LTREQTEARVSAEKSLQSEGFEHRLAAWTFEGAAGPDTGPARVAKPEQLAGAVCRVLARQNPRFRWDGKHLSSLHFHKPHVKEKPAFASTVGRGRAVIESMNEEREWREARRGASVSELLTTTARQIGVSYATLYRVTHGTAAAVSWETIWRLQGYCRGEADRHAILAAVLTPKARRVRREYAAYVSRELQRLSRRRLGKHDVPLSASERTLLHRFHAKALRVGADARRIRLAQLRAYDGLVGWSRLREAIQPAERARLIKRAYRHELELLQLEHEALSASMGEVQRNVRIC
jgi:hypothetical protein